MHVGPFDELLRTSRPGPDSGPRAAPRFPSTGSLRRLRVQCRRRRQPVNRRRRRPVVDEQQHRVPYDRARFDSDVRGDHRVSHAPGNELAGRQQTVGHLGTLGDTPRSRAPARGLDALTRFVKVDRRLVLEQFHVGFPVRRHRSAVSPVTLEAVFARLTCGHQLRQQVIAPSSATCTTPYRPASLHPPGWSPS